MVDDASERLLADEEMLAALGYEPVGFTRADDALAACRANPKRFDALLVGRFALCQVRTRPGCCTARGRAGRADPAGDGSADEIGADL